MKRVGHLFESVTDFANLLRATHQAARGKTGQPRVAHFWFHLETELLTLQEELRQGRWRPSNFRVFEIREPKLRRISAADFRDRVVHHAICNLLEPVLDKRLIFDTWACRRGKGSHRAVARAQWFCRRYPYFLKCDVRRYFDTIDHAVLKSMLGQILKDRPLIELLERIIDHPLPGVLPGKGLPIGNLTSQHFANLYLSELDHQLKDRQGLKAYLRYMDDMLIFAEDKAQLHAIQRSLEEFIGGRLQLQLKLSATRLAPVSEGVPFLGFRIFPGLIRLNRQSLQRFRHRLYQRQQDYLSGKIEVEGVAASVTSMIAHMAHANTHRLRQSFLPSSLPQG